MSNTLYVPTWLYINQHHLKPNENEFFAFPVACAVPVFNHNMAGLTINPVYRPISQQPGPMKMHQATRYPWSYIRNYNQIHYQCSYTSPIP